MADALLRAVANPANQALLSLLAVEPSHPRRMASLLGLAESEVARRLKRLEGLGLVASQWVQVGRNVKQYRLVAEKVDVRFTRAGIEAQIGSGPARPLAPQVALGRPPPPPPAFLGRERELAVLSGREPIVLVEGIAGSGKTALVSRFVAGKPDVLWVPLRGVESLGWLANHVALYAAQHGDATLLDALEGGIEPSHLGSAIVQALDVAGRITVLDDVHKAGDRDVRDWLAFTIAAFRNAKLVVASRERVVHASRPGLARVGLAGFGDGEVVRFLQSKGLDVPAALVPRVHQEVGGHPLALNLLAEAAGDVQRLVGLLDRKPERDVEEYLLGELDAALGDMERAALMHASVFRTAFTARDLDAIGGRRSETAVSQLRRRLLLQEASGGYRLHELLRNFYHGRLGDPPLLHRRAAEHYLARGTLEGRLEALHHFVTAGTAADRRRAIEVLEQNLDLRDFDFVDAGYRSLYASVLSLFGRDEVGDDRRWALLQDERGDLALVGGEPDAALACFEEARRLFASVAEPERAADNGWKAALCLERLGRRNDAVALARQALSTAPPGPARDRLDAFLRAPDAPAGPHHAGPR